MRLFACLRFIPNLSNFASRLLKRKVPVKTIPKGLLKLSFQQQSPNPNLQLHSWCAVSRQRVGSTLRLRKIAPLCSRNVVFDAMSGTLDTTRTFVLRTCSRKPLLVKSTRPNLSNAPSISPAVAKCWSKCLLDSASRRFYQ